MTRNMLISMPAKHYNHAAVERWQDTKHDLMAVHKNVWQKVEGNAPIFQENSRYAEWSDGKYEHKGMRNSGNQQHGISRRIRHTGSGSIYEWCFKNSSYQGLFLEWDTSGRFWARIFQNGSEKGYIQWDKNWNETSQSNKAYCLELFTIADFKPGQEAGAQIVEPDIAPVEEEVDMGGLFGDDEYY